jgi:hypothetical protein
MLFYYPPIIQVHRRHVKSGSDLTDKAVAVPRQCQAPTAASLTAWLAVLASYCASHLTYKLLLPEPHETNGRRRRSL